MQYKELTEKIIGCAYLVYNRMGFGFLESIYKKCLIIELKKIGLKVNEEIPVNVFYDSEMVGEFTADILVEDRILLKLKSGRRILKTHEIQLNNCLAATKKDVGLLLNFGELKVEVKRKARRFLEVEFN